MASQQMRAILHLAEHPLVARILEPVMDAEKETIHWDRLNYGVLSGGEKAAISWAWTIWTDEQTPTSWEEYPGYRMRDPFEGFGVMDTSLQMRVLEAMAIRWGLAEASKRRAGGRS